MESLPMTFNPISWYCRPVANGFWDKVAESALGRYTPCCIDTLVVSFSNLVLMCLCIHRILLIQKSHTVHKYQLTSRKYHIVLIILAALLTSEPLFRILSDTSIFNLDHQPGIPPFELVSILIQATAWASMTVLTFLETRVYICDFRLLVRFGIAYVLVGDVAMINLLLPVKASNFGLVLYLYISGVMCKVLFGALLLFHVPNLDPYPGYTLLKTESFDYEALRGEEEVCPETHVSMISWLFFEWITPLMRQGHKQPITEKDVWKLDAWDQTERLHEK